MAIVIPIISTFDGKGVKESETAIGSAEKKWQGAGKALNSALLPATAALAGITAVGIKFAKAASDDRAAAAKMAKAVQNATGATDAQIASTEEWITAQGRLLGVSDDELRPAIQILSQSTGDLAKAQEEAGLAMDIAASAGVSAEDAAKALAKANDGSFGSLKKLVPGIDDAALASKDFGRITKDTAKLVDGQAAAAAEADGGLGIFQLTMSELGETLGAVLLPVLDAIVPLLQSFADFAGNNTGLIIGITAAVAGFAAAIVAANVALSVYNTIQSIMAINAARAAAGQWALNASLLANPVVLIVVGIIALVAALVLAYKKSETFRKIVDGAFRAVMDAVKVAIDFIVNALEAGFKVLAFLFKFTPLGLLITHFKELKAVVGVVADAVIGAWQRVWDFLSGIFQKIRDGIDRIKGLFSGLKFPDLNPFNNSAASFSSGASTRAGDQNTTNNFTISGVTDPEGTARAIQRSLYGHQIRQGIYGKPRALAW